ncbi:hypothetical protein Scep_002767 [Stephania cephalantha]|uniref:Uncharacterized protein n=1 Tax=Stephania cephalantha TaxID=152367 RepID=A0AAP0Q934_9MAGN
MNYEYGEESQFCYFHPTERLIGVCAFCLNERLLILASKQRHKDSSTTTRSTHHHNISNTTTTTTTNTNTTSSASAAAAATTTSGTNFHHCRKPSLTFPKIFALGSFLHRHHESRPANKPGGDLDDNFGDASTSQEDSFISIKFEDNGIASWDKGNKSFNHNFMKMNKEKIISNNINKDEHDQENTKSVVEHVKPQSALRWRKRIGQLFQIVRRKRSNKASVSHIGSKAGGVKVRNGWIRNLTKRRTME